MRKGFTLIELIIVVIVIGLLATFAIPQYLKAMERTQGAKAKNAMALIASAEKMCRAETETYASTTATTNNSVLGAYIELASVDNDNDWRIAVVGTANTFTITATRSGTVGGTLTLDQDGEWGGTGRGATGVWVP